MWVAASAWLSRIFSAGAQFVLVRLLLETLGLEEYAVFAVVTGLVAWFNLADFGIGVSVQNRISESRAVQGDARPIALLGRLTALGLLIIGIPVAYLASPYAADFLLSSLTTMDAQQKRWLFFIAASAFSVAGISGIVYKIWYAEQRGYLANLIPALAALLGLVGVWMATQAAPEQRLTLSLIAFVVPTAGFPLVLLLWQLARSDFGLLRHLDGAQIKAGLRHAFGFWVFAVLATITLQMDYVILPRFLSAHDIAVYTILIKVFGLAFFVYNAMLMALWPVLAELQTRRDWPAMSKYLRRYINAGIAGIALFTLMLVFGMPTVLRILAPGQSLEIPRGLLLGFGAYFVMRIWCDTYSTVLQSMSRMRPFWILVPLQAALCAGFQWALAPRIGLYGILVGLFVSFLLTVAWGLPYAVARYTRIAHPAGP